MSLHEIGVTFENRSIYLVNITDSNVEQINKSIVSIDGGIHAREWISPGVILSFIRNLTSDEHTEQRSSLLTKFEFHLIPVLNPDGYEYTWTTDRLWRKNRSPSKTGPSLLYPWTFFMNCIGTDLNRNFNVSFGSIRSTKDTCSDSFHGDSPFSEKETQALRDSLMESRHRLKVYITLHSYSQLWMMPFAHTMQVPDNIQRLLPLMREVQSSIEGVHGVKYGVGSMANLLYPAAGTSIDWVFQELGINYTFLIELRDHGLKGFLLPPSDIIPTAEEVWAGIRVILSHTEIEGSTHRTIVA